MRTVTLAQFRRFLRTEVEAAAGVNALGRVLDISPMRISEVLAHGKPPGDTLLRALGFRRKPATMRYERTR